MLNLLIAHWWYQHQVRSFGGRHARRGISPKNKLHGEQKLWALLDSAREIPQQTALFVYSAVKQSGYGKRQVFVGRVYDSCVYHIGCDTIENAFKLKFSTPDERNKFANSFETACIEQGLSVHQSF